MKNNDNMLSYDNVIKQIGKKICLDFEDFKQLNLKEKDWYDEEEIYSLLIKNILIQEINRRISNLKRVKDLFSQKELIFKVIYSSSNDCNQSYTENVTNLYYLFKLINRFQEILRDYSLSLKCNINGCSYYDAIHELVNETTVSVSLNELMEIYSLEKSKDVKFDIAKKK